VASQENEETTEARKEVSGDLDVHQVILC